MSRTTFRNANGLPDSKQKSTARDMATLSMALIRDFPQYYDYFKRTSFKYRGVTYAGHNKLLKTFKGYDGIKTGYIRASGFNLASSAERDGRRLVVVVMGGTSPSMRDRKVADLLTTGFKTKGGSGPVLVAKAPDAIAEPQAKPFVPAQAESAQPVSVVEDVIANILVKPAEADVLAEADVAMTGVRLAGVKSLAPMLKPGTGTATVASAPDTQATTVVWKPEGNYGIQVGAYSKYNAAQKAAQTAAKAEAALLSDARIIIDTQKMNSGGKVYRARVAGLTKADAQTACKNLKAKDTDCLVLKISSALAMGN
jgi:D-alanyl-D-alanine carboxypeptidase